MPYINVLVAAFGLFNSNKLGQRYDGTFFLIGGGRPITFATWADVLNYANTPRKREEFPFLSSYKNDRKMRKLLRRTPEPPSADSWAWVHDVRTCYGGSHCLDYGCPNIGLASVGNDEFVISNMLASEGPPSHCHKRLSRSQVLKWASTTNADDNANTQALKAWVLSNF